MPAGKLPSPPGTRYKKIGPGHTRVYAHDTRSGRSKWIVIGELRRNPKRLQTPWRAFPEGAIEFPKRFRVHAEGMKYLLDRWVERGRPLPRKPGEREWDRSKHQWARDPRPRRKPQGWETFFDEAMD